MAVAAAFPLWTLYSKNLDPMTTAAIATRTDMVHFWGWPLLSVVFVTIGVLSLLATVTVPGVWVRTAARTGGLCGIASVVVVYFWANVQHPSPHVIPGVGGWIAIAASFVSAGWPKSRARRFEPAVAGREERGDA